MNEIIDALPGLGAVSLATGLIAAHRLIFGDPDANQHDISDYKEPALAPERRNWPLVDRQRTATPATATKPDNLAEVLWTPPYAELTVAAVVRRYGDSPADIAARFLRELAAEQVTR